MRPSLGFRALHIGMMALTFMAVFSVVIGLESYCMREQEPWLRFVASALTGIALQQVLRIWLLKPWVTWLMKPRPPKDVVYVIGIHFDPSNREEH